MNTSDEQSQDHLLRQKLDNFEFRLPPIAWDNMQARLDEAQVAHDDEALRQKVANHNLPPPAYAWDELLEQLDQTQPASHDNQLRLEVSEFEFSLPAAAWDQLDNQLDQQTIQDKVANYDFQMPTTAWDNMAARLDQAQEQRRRRKAAAWWWSAAAALLLLAGVSAYLYSPKTTPTTSTPTAILHDATTQSTPTPSTNLHQTLLQNAFNSFTKSAPLLQNSTQNILPSAKPNPAPIASNSNNSTTTKPNTTTPINNTILPPSIAQHTNNSNTTNINTTSPIQQNTLPNHTDLAANHCSDIININSIDPEPLAYTANITNPIELEKGNTTPWQGHVWAGVNAKAIQGTGEVSLSPVIGVGASYQLDAQNKLMVGVQFKQITTQGGLAHNLAAKLVENNPAQSNTFAPQYASDCDPYTPTADIYQLRKINMIEVPLAYHYQINRRHAFEVGAKLGIVTHIATSRRHNQESPAFNFRRDDVGIGPLNMSSILAYEYKFNPNWSLHVQYTAGFSNLMYSAQKKYRPYASFWGEDAHKGNVYLLVADNKPAPPVLVEAPEKMFNNDLQLSLRFNF